MSVENMLADGANTTEKTESLGRSSKNILYRRGRGRQSHGRIELQPEYEDALARFVTHLSGKTKRTREIYAGGVRKFFWFLQERWGSPDLEALSREHVESWVSFLAGESGYSPQSIHMSVQAARVFCERLVDIDFLDDNPFRFIKGKDLPKINQTEVRILTVEEMAAMYKVCIGERTVWGRRDGALIVMLFYGGFRASELLNVKERDIDWQGQRVNIVRGKGGNPRTVGLKAEAMNVLERYMVARRKYLRTKRSYKREMAEKAPIWLSQQSPSLGIVALNLMLKRRAAQAGVTKPVNPHAWRHTAATLDAQGSEGQQMLEGELREKYGWSPGSPQVYHYTRATVRERAATRSQQVRGDDGFRP